jgi:thiol-disulfide isomerase/thioredoxin
MNNITGDPSAPFYKKHFDLALEFNKYVESGSASDKSRWLSAYQNIKLSNEQEKLLKSFKRKLNILVISGIWCGDCVRQCPILAKFAECNQLVDLRFIDNNEYPELRDRFRIQGGTRVPVALFLSEDFNEVARFGDKTLFAYRRKAERELGEACDSGLGVIDSDEMAGETKDWLEQLERVQLILRLSPALRNRYND